MTKLKNVGAYPDTENSLGVRSYADARFAQQGVVGADLTAALNTAKAPLSLKSYIDQQDALYTTKTYVDQQDNLLTNATQLGASNGIAKLDASGKISAPTPLKNAAGVRSYHMTYSGVHSVTSARECTSITIPYPGFLWLPMWFGWTLTRWVSGGDRPWGSVSIRQSVGGSWYARGVAGARYASDNVGSNPPDVEKTVINMVPTTDIGAGLGFNTSVTFRLYYQRDWGSGTLEIGDASSWFTCLVIPVSGFAPTPIA